MRMLTFLIILILRYNPTIITDDDRFVTFDLTLEKYYGNTWEVEVEVEAQRVSIFMLRRKSQWN